MSKSETDRILSDPANHFPYARDRAEDAGIPKELIDVSEAVVKAQEAYLKDPSDKNLQARNEAERKAQQVSQARRERMAAPVGAAAETVEGKAQ